MLRTRLTHYLLAAQMGAIVVDEHNNIISQREASGVWLNSEVSLNRCATGHHSPDALLTRSPQTRKHTQALISWVTRASRHITEATPTMRAVSGGGQA